MTNNDLIKNIQNPKNPNYKKIFKTIRGFFKKAIYYLDMPVPYDLTKSLVDLKISRLPELCKKYPLLKELFVLNKDIRTTDDILDEELSRRDPKPLVEMNRLIEAFKGIDKRYKTVAKLFRFQTGVANKIA